MKNPELDLEQTQFTRRFFTQILRKIYGWLLVILSLSLIAFIFFPHIPALICEKQNFLQDEEHRTLAFWLMPFVLFAQYVWFASTERDRSDTLLLCIVLIVASLIPFLNLILGR